MEKKTIDDLNDLYRRADEADQEVFAEQRSNILLVAGEHYTKRSAKFWNRIRDSKELTSEQKLRLTKNHIHRIMKIYDNAILQYCPDTVAEPNNPNELADQKSAELHNSVLKYIKKKSNRNERRREWVEDFDHIGEVAVKVFWDKDDGDLIGYEHDQDESGQEIGEKRPVFSGMLKYERIFGFNLFRDPEAKSMDESPWLGVRKLMSKKTLQDRLKDDPEKSKLLEGTKDDTYQVFDGVGGGYRELKDQVMIREYYFKTCPEYPMGYYYITTEAGVLWEGELPFGKFPIKYKGFDSAQTHPRSRSLIKQLRPYQAEINRSASKIAEHQISLGDDKVITSAGAKMQNGATAPGVRQYQVSSPDKVTIIPGRSGEQYSGYMEGQIKEMYDVANIDQILAEKDIQADAYTLLFRSASQKKAFSLYVAKFQEFLAEVDELSLELMREYCTEDMVIPIIGKPERVNIPEFKNSLPLSYQIKISAVTDDVESIVGKQLALSQAIQYVGNNLNKDDIGKILKNMPYLQGTKELSDFTLNYDNSTNEILALDRGEQVIINKYDDHPYMIQKLTNRMRQADFKYLSKEIQANYEEVVGMHQDLEAQKLAELKAMESELIPTGGALVAVDFYVNAPDKPNTTRRARFPYEALDWLRRTLEAQTAGLQPLYDLPKQAASEIGQKTQQLVAGQSQAQPGQEAQQMPSSPQMPQPGQS